MGHQVKTYERPKTPADPPAWQTVVGELAGDDGHHSLTLDLQRLKRSKTTAQVFP